MSILVYSLDPNPPLAAFESLFQLHISSQSSTGVQGPLEKVYRAALALCTANQLTNILRDVGEDAKQRNRIYVPREDLERFKISESEVRA